MPKTIMLISLQNMFTVKSQ